MGSGLLWDRQGRPSPWGIAVAVACLGFVTVLVVLVFGAVLGLVLGVPAMALWSIVSGAVLGPLTYLAVVRPLLRARPAPAASSAGAPMVDPVTHTLNRPGITSSLLEAMAQSQRYGTPLCVALLQLDGLASLAERRGPEGADQAAQWAASLITETLRLPDRVGRQQPGEFLVVMPQTRGPAAVKVAERLREAVGAASAHLAQGTETFTLSVGVAEFGKGQDLEKLLSRAQSALEEAKAAGGNGVRRAKTPRRRKSPEATVD